MKYNWTNKDKENDIELLKKLIEEEKNPIKRRYIEIVLGYTESLFIYEKINKYENSQDFEKILYDRTNDYVYNKSYYDFMDTYYETIKREEKRLEGIDTLIMDYERIYPDYEVNLSNEDVMELVHDFYINTDSIFKKLFNEVYEKRYKLIKFPKKSKILTETNSLGECFYIDILRKNYIMVKDIKGLAKARNLAHEIDHAVACLYQPKRLYFQHDTFFNELSSLFFELAFLEENSIKNNVETPILKYDKLSYIIAEIDCFETQKKVINMLKEQDYIFNDKNFKKIYTSLDINKNILTDMMYDDITYDGSYVISYLVALNLLKIYRQDKKEALKLLRIMLNMYEKDTLTIIKTIFKELNYFEEEIYNIEKEITKKLSVN